MCCSVEQQCSRQHPSPFTVLTNMAQKPTQPEQRIDAGQESSENIVDDHSREAVRSKVRQQSILITLNVNVVNILKICHSLWFFSWFLPAESQFIIIIVHFFWRYKDYRWYLCVLGTAFIRERRLCCLKVVLGVLTAVFHHCKTASVSEFSACYLSWGLVVSLATAVAHCLAGQRKC